MDEPPLTDDTRYEVMFCTGPPGFADMTRAYFATLEAARAHRRDSRENADPYFRWSKITDRTTDKQVEPRY